MSLRACCYTAIVALAAAACAESPSTGTISVGTVTVVAPSAGLRVAETLDLDAVVKSADGALLADREVAWSSSNSAVAAVAAGGLVTGAGVGMVTITATS